MRLASLGAGLFREAETIGSKIVSVTGAAHVRGIINYLTDEGGFKVNCN